MKRRFMLLASVLCAVTALGVVPSAASHAATPTGGTSRARPKLPGFRLSDTESTGSELNLGITSKGAVFVGGWDHVARSLDAGKSWTALPCSTGPVCAAADRTLIVDRTTDRVFVDDTTLACTVMAWSDDLGATWTANPQACGGGAYDHEKIAAGKRTALTDPTGDLYPNIVYVCGNALGYTPCSSSLDGGLAFGPAIPAGSTGADGTATCAFQGALATASDGTLYQPKSSCGRATLEWTKDNALSWSSSTVFAGADPVSGDVPDVAVTPDGTIYYFWTEGNWRPYLARSSDGGATWTPPMAVAPSIRSALFPVVAAGSNGHIGLAFYGTTDAPSGWDGNPGTAPASVQWNLYSAVITNAGAAAPTIKAVKVTHDPVQIGCLSKLGACDEFNIADYIDAEVTPKGRLYIAYVDGCPPGCSTHAQSTADEAFLAVQTKGPSL